MSDVDVLWSSDTCLADHPSASKGFDTGIKVIYDEEWAYEEIILSYYDEAGLNETLTFECDSPAERRKSAFNFLSDATYKDLILFEHLSPSPQVCRAKFSFADVDLSQCVSLLLLSIDELKRSWKSGWQAQRKPKHATVENQTTAHQSTKEYCGYELHESQQLQEYIFMPTNEENRKIFDEGMIKDRVENLNMSVYVRTISGKTISIKCDRRQNTARIMDKVARQPQRSKNEEIMGNDDRIQNKTDTTAAMTEAINQTI